MPPGLFFQIRPDEAFALRTAGACALYPRVSSSGNRTHGEPRTPQRFPELTMCSKLHARRGV